MLRRTYLIILLQLIVQESYFCNATFCLGVNDSDSFIASKIGLRLYTGDPWQPTSTNFSVDQADKILELTDPTKGFVLYIHGFRENSLSESVQTIVNAYLRRGRDNVIVLDWGDLAFDHYTLVVCRSKAIGKIMANAIDKTLQAGLDLNTLHIIGHSAGAHIAGFAGEFSKNSVPRITGLDPALPSYYPFNSTHISERSAKHVDIVHTDGGVYGALEPTGTVDFFANGGIRPQPGCLLLGIILSPRDLCSHWASWRYYAATVIDDAAYLAVECSSYGKYLLGQCKDNQQAYFGYSTPTNISGKYYFNTNS